MRLTFQGLTVISPSSGVPMKMTEARAKELHFSWNLLLCALTARKRCVILPASREKTRERIQMQ